MITLIDAENALDKTQHPFMVKTINGYRRKVLQHDKGLIQQTLSQYPTQWWETEGFPSKIRNKIRMPILTTVTQHNAGSPKHTHSAKLGDRKSKHKVLLLPIH